MVITLLHEALHDSVFIQRVTRGLSAGPETEKPMFRSLAAADEAEEPVMRGLGGYYYESLTRKL